MSREQEEAARRLRLGIIVVIASVLLFITLFLIGSSEYLLSSKAEVRADFRTITGLRKGSPVHLAGVEVGRVSAVDFARVQYQCEPLTEDVGRYGTGRTNDCDNFLFCSPVGLCADLEPFAGKGYHNRCSTTEECAEDEICVTGEFRRRAPKVIWSGPHGVCSRFRVEHWRTQVIMSVREPTLDLIRADSHAMVAANSVLGDQLVSITPGQGAELTGDNRIQAVPSVYEDISRFRDRLDSITDKADTSILAISDVIGELKDERTMEHLRGIVTNSEVITRRLAYGEGMIGAMLSSRDYRRDVGKTIYAVHNISGKLETTVGTSNAILNKVDNNLEPVIGDARSTLRAVDQLLVDLDDPANKSLAAKVLRDPKGDLARDIEGTVHHSAEISSSVNEIAAAVDRGDGDARQAHQRSHAASRSRPATAQHRRPQGPAVVPRGLLAPEGLRHEGSPRLRQVMRQAEA